jgi:hypothetical protein
MVPADFYGVRGAGFTNLRRELGWLPGDAHPQEESLTRAIGAGLLHLDDPDRLRATAAALAAPSPPDPERLGERERRQWLMLTASCAAPASAGGPCPLPSPCSGRPQPGATNCASCWSCWPSAPIAASTRCPGPCRCPCASTAATAEPRSKPPLASSATTPHGSTAKASSGTNPATPTCCS